MRTIFLVLQPPGTGPTAVSLYLPANQRLKQALQAELALRQAVKPELDLGTADLYSLRDIYEQPIDPTILVCQVPFPGCVIAVFNAAEVRIDGKTLSGEEGVKAVTRTIAMFLISQRKDDDNKMSLRYARFIEGGDWRFVPTPITSHDLGLTYHEKDATAATRLLELLADRKLRCRTRCVASAPESSSRIGEADQPTEDVRAFAVLVSRETKHEAWIAYDVGAAWARGIPVVPILVGDWTEDPPNILAPYQQLKWNTQQERIVEQLVAMLDLTPWEIPVQSAADTYSGLSPEIVQAARNKLARAMALAKQKTKKKAGKRKANGSRAPAGKEKRPRKKSR